MLLLVLMVCIGNAQDRALKKAVQGKMDSRFLYTATFKNLPLKKKGEIKQWCSKNGYKLIDTQNEVVERFGGHRETFIASARIRSVEDDNYLEVLSWDDAKSYVLFMETYKLSRHYGTIEKKFISSVKTISECKSYISTFPKLEQALEVRAYDIAKKKNKSSNYSGFIEEFPDSEFREEALNNLCNSISTVIEAKKYLGLYPHLEAPVTQRAITIVKSKDSPKSYSDFILNFPEDQYREQASKELCNRISTIDDTKKYISLHNELKQEISEKAFQIVKRYKTLEVCSDFLKHIDAPTHKSEVEKLFLSLMTDIKSCAFFIKEHSDLEDRIDLRAIDISEKGGFDVKKEYVSLIPEGSKAKIFQHEINETKKRELEEKENIIKERIAAFQNGAEAEQREAVWFDNSFFYNTENNRLERFESLSFAELITSNSFQKELPHFRVDMELEEFYNIRRKIKNEVGKFRNGWVTTITGCKVQLYESKGFVSSAFVYKGDCKNGLADGNGVVYSFSGDNYRPLKVHSELHQAYYEKGVPVSNIYRYEGGKIIIIAPSTNPSIPLKVVVSFQKPYNKRYSRDQATLLIQKLLLNISMGSTMLELIEWWEGNDFDKYIDFLSVSECKAYAEIPTYSKELTYVEEGKKISFNGSFNNKDAITIALLKNGSIRGVVENFYFEEETVVTSIKEYRSEKIISKQKLGGELIVDHCESGDCQNGYGVHVFASGTRYEGTFKGGKFHGEGTYIWPSGSKYIGDFQNGVFHGQGKTINSDGQSGYVGGFKDGERHGYGRMFGPIFLVDNYKKGYWENGRYVGKVSPQQMENLSYRFRTRVESSFFYDIMENGKVISKVQISTYFSDRYYNISSFGNKYGVDGAYYPKTGRLVHSGESKKEEEGVNSLQMAIERLFYHKYK